MGLSRQGLPKREKPVATKNSDFYYANSGQGVNRRPYVADESDILT